MIGEFTGTETTRLAPNVIFGRRLHLTAHVCGRRVRAKARVTTMAQENVIYGFLLHCSLHKGPEPTIYETGLTEPATQEARDVAH